MPPPKFDDNWLFALAPLNLRNSRVNRYHGDDVAISVAQFTESDRAVLFELYSFLQELFDALTGHDPEREKVFQRFIDGQNVPAILDRVRSFGGGKLPQ